MKSLFYTYLISITLSTISFPWFYNPFAAAPEHHEFTYEDPVGQCPFWSPLIPYWQSIQSFVQNHIPNFWFKVAENKESVILMFQSDDFKNDDNRKNILVTQKTNTFNNKTSLEIATGYMSATINADSHKKFPDKTLLSIMFKEERNENGTMYSQQSSQQILVDKLELEHATAQITKNDGFLKIILPKKEPVKNEAIAEKIIPIDFAE